MHPNWTHLLFWNRFEVCKRFKAPVPFKIFVSFTEFEIVQKLSSEEPGPFFVFQPYNNKIAQTQGTTHS